MSPMMRLILMKEYTEKQGDYESLLPPREGSCIPTSKLFLQQIKMENDERTLCKSTQGVRWIAQCNGANILLARIESSRE
jgi:hypothetical protein